MTTTQQHIEDLDVDTWAVLTRRAARDAVAAAARLGMQPPSELRAVAAMTERELVEHRKRSGPATKRLSPVMQLVEADRLRSVAERLARDAQQDKQDADAAASVARVQAEESARAATAARQRARAAEANAARKQVEWTAERAAGQRALEQVRAELEKVRADAAAEVAVDRERASAAEARAEQRAAERTAERTAGQQALQQVRAELETVRANATAEVAAAREYATGEVAAARQTAIAEVVRARAEADDARRAAAARTASTQLSTIPVPPLEVRSHTRRIESALTALYQIDYVLEVRLDELGGSHIPLDVDLVRRLVWTVQEQAADLSGELAALPGWFTNQPQLQSAAAEYANAAPAAVRAFLQRIDTAARRLPDRDRSPDAEVVELVANMVADLWDQMSTPRLQ